MNTATHVAHIPPHIYVSPHVYLPTYPPPCLSIPISVCPRTRIGKDMAVLAAGQIRKRVC